MPGGSASTGAQRQADNKRLEILLVFGSGLLLYPLLAFGDRLIGAPPLASALFEEMLKLLFLASAAFYGSIRASRSRRALRYGGRGSWGASGIAAKLAYDRSRLSGAARGLGLGLAAVAVFATCENLAYFIAIPGTGILGRLLWSEPVHLVAALAEAIGLFQCFELFGGRKVGEKERGRLGTEPHIGATEPHIGATEPHIGATEPHIGATRRSLPLLALARALSLFLGFTTLGFGWHFFANFLASGQLSPIIFAAVALANILALFILGRLFAAQVVIGGFIYGAE